MELFDEVKNRYFQLVFRIINECADGKAKADLIKIIDNGEFEQKLISKNQQSFADMILNRGKKEESLNLLREKEGLYYPCIDSNGELPLPVRFTNLEKAWLKALLNQSEIKLLLSNNTLEKLQKELEGYDSPVRDEYIEMTNTIKLPEIFDRDKYKENFRLILKALTMEKAVRYSNLDRNGNLYSNKLALPINLEFSMRDSRFRVSMFSIDEQRPVMANIYSMSDISIIDEDVGIDRETAKNMLFQQKYSEQPIVLEVTDKNYAMERCFMCFSRMERTARELGDNKYEIKLNYYLFEEEGIIRDILSLGPYVKVISPKRIQEEVIKRVKSAIAL